MRILVKTTPTKLDVLNRNVDFMLGIFIHHKITTLFHNLE